MAVGGQRLDAPHQRTVSRARVQQLQAVALRWQWDGSVPWLAVATLVLAMVLTGFGIVLKDETFVLVRPTVGALTFAGILVIGAFARPSLLKRTLGYRASRSVNE